MPGKTLNYYKVMKLIGAQPELVYEVTYQRQRLYRDGRKGTIKPGGATNMSPGMIVTAEPKRMDLE